MSLRGWAAGIGVRKTCLSDVRPQSRVVSYWRGRVVIARLARHPDGLDVIVGPFVTIEKPSVAELAEALSASFVFGDRAISDSDARNAIASKPLVNALGASQRKLEAEAASCNIYRESDGSIKYYAAPRERKQETGFHEERSFPASVSALELAQAIADEFEACIALGFIPRD